MSSTLLVLTAAVVLTAADTQAASLRYTRPADGAYVVESEITTTRTNDGLTYASLTDRGTEKMTLTLRFDKDNQVTLAEALLENAQGKKSVTLILEGPNGQLKRGGTTDFFEVAANPVVTTAPDWSDIFQLVHRYDAAKAGKQEFPGLWIHPSVPPQVLTFTIEHTGNDSIMVKDQRVSLDRYQVHLRNGDYLVWADAARRVYKLLPPGPRALPVMLEGYEEPTRALK